MSEDARAGMNAVVAFLCVVAVLVTPWVALSEAFMASCFMGCGVPEGTPRDKANGVSVAFILGTVVPVLGIALSHLHRPAHRAQAVRCRPAAHADHRAGGLGR